MVNQIPLHALIWFLENGNIKSRKPRKFWNIITTEAFRSILAIWITLEKLQSLRRRHFAQSKVWTLNYGNQHIDLQIVDCLVYGNSG